MGGDSRVYGFYGVHVDDRLNERGDVLAYVLVVGSMRIGGSRAFHVVVDRATLFTGSCELLSIRVWVLALMGVSKQACMRLETEKATTA